MKNKIEGLFLVLLVVTALSLVFGFSSLQSQLTALFVSLQLYPGNMPSPMVPDLSSQSVDKATLALSKVKAEYDKAISSSDKQARLEALRVALVTRRDFVLAEMDSSPDKY